MLRKNKDKHKYVKDLIAKDYCKKIARKSQEFYENIFNTAIKYNITYLDDKYMDVLANYLNDIKQLTQNYVNTMFSIDSKFPLEKIENCFVCGNNKKD